MNLGENIYRLRTDRNMSQGDFAEALDVSRQSVSKWENNTAVPELDKLVKMAEIFHITLDELVSGEKPETAPASLEKPEQTEKIIYVERTIPATVSAWNILGVALLIASIGVGLILSNYDKKFGLLEIFLMTLPIAICGIVCIIAKHPSPWCAWIVSISYWLYFFIIANHWEAQGFLIFLGILLVIGCVFYTVNLHKRNTIHVQAWIWALMVLVLTAAAVMLFINLGTLSFEHVYETPPSQIRPNN